MSKRKSRYVTPAQLEPAVKDVLEGYRWGAFGPGDRGARYWYAKEALQECGLPARRSLCWYVAKLAAIRHEAEIMANRRLNMIEDMEMERF